MRKGFKLICEMSLKVRIKLDIMACVYLFNFNITVFVNFLNSFSHVFILILRFFLLNREFFLIVKSTRKEANTSALDFCTWK